MGPLMKALVSSGLLFGVTLLCPDRVYAQTPTANEIVTRMMERNVQRQEMLQHYASDQTYRLEYNGTAGEHHAEMVVHVEYTAPGRKHFTVLSESGSKPLCAEVLRKLVEGEEETAAKHDWQQAMFSPETYNLQLLGSEQLGGVNTWVLQVEPKVASKVAYRGKVWVSMEDFATVRVQGEPAKNPSWLLDRASFDSWYMRRGDVWVPEKNISTSHVRIGGQATVTIDYGRYPVLDTTPMNAAMTAPAESDPLSRSLPPAGVGTRKGMVNSLR